MDVLKLLAGKNRYLLRFEQTSLAFLSATEAPALPLGDFEGALSSLEKTRARILKAIELFDRKLTEVAESLPDEARSRANLDGLKGLARDTDEILARLLKIDEKILQRIQQAKDRVSQEISAADRSRQTMNKFRSCWVSTSGEGLDQTL
jgi:hypothetical protein